MGLVYRKGYGKRKEREMMMIAECMEEHNIDPESVPRGKQGRVVQYCHGNFTCKTCIGKTWVSSWSWILFDLRNQKIRYRFHQKCATCLTPTEPELEDDKMRNLVDKVCRKYLRRIDQAEPETEEDPIDPQDDPTEVARMKSLFRGALNSTTRHLPKLCEKCGYGHLEPCYAAVLRKYQQYFKYVEKNSFYGRPRGITNIA